MEKIFIGVAWPYANGPLHLGHICGAYLPADIFARYCRLKGDKVLMVSGSDEHGTPISLKAEEIGRDPQEVVDYYHKVHVRDLERLSINFDLFTRTTTDNHTRVVQSVFKKIFDEGYIYPKEVEVLYCPVCKRYLPDRYVEGICPFCGNEDARGDQCPDCGKTLDATTLMEPKCKICGTRPEIRKSEHLFFKLSAFEDRLKKWISKQNHWRDNVKKFTENWLKSGLKDRPITRDLSWGIPVPIPGFEDKTIYVWFDAVTGYLSASKEWAIWKGDENLWREYWENPETKHYYFIAKDNIPFHSIIWPSMLMAYGELNLPYQIPANEFLRLGKEQFSKSTGTCIWVGDCFAGFNSDVIRYCLVKIMPENRDSECDIEAFVDYNNNELVSNLGNLVHRVLTFTQKNFGKIPERKGSDPEDELFLKKVESTFQKVGNSLAECQFKEGLKAIMLLAKEGNRYFDRNAPWDLVKSDRQRCGTVLHCLLKMVRSTAFILFPYMPQTSEKMWKMLGNKDKLRNHRWGEALAELEGGMELPQPEILFAKVKKEDLFENPFNRLDLRIGKIESVEPHPDADKLWVLKVDLGMLGERQLIAGLKPYYRKEELLGRNIVVFVNLKPRVLRGLESQGMLLAAESEGEVSILTPGGKAEPGEQVTVQGVLPMPKKEASMNDFMNVQFVVDEEGNIRISDIPLTVQGSKIRTDRPLKPRAKIR
jgi:methionyl-tRNA synthetase